MAAGVVWPALSSMDCQRWEVSILSFYRALSWRGCSAPGIGVRASFRCRPGEAPCESWPSRGPVQYLDQARGGLGSKTVPTPRLGITIDRRGCGWTPERLNNCLISRNKAGKNIVYNQKINCSFLRSVIRAKIIISNYRPAKTENIFIFYNKLFFKVYNFQFKFSMSKGQLPTLIQKLCILKTL